MVWYGNKYIIVCITAYVKLPLLIVCKLAYVIKTKTTKGVHFCIGSCAQIEYILQI